MNASDETTLYNNPSQSQIPGTFAGHLSEVALSSDLQPERLVILSHAQLCYAAS